MAAKKETATYTHTHHSSAVGDHARRGATDSAGFLLSHIQPHFKILDVGCGPGTISADLAALVPEGHLTGVDAVEAVLDQARKTTASRGITNITFQHADANALPFDDNTFDVAFNHQVLQHVGAPVDVLSEMRRVVKPGGIVASREANYASFCWYPEAPLLDRWLELYSKVARANGGEPDAGRYLFKWARDAGFKAEEIDATWECWRWSGERVKGFSESHGGRILQSGFLNTATKNGFATKEEVKKISEAWFEWGVQEDAYIAIPNSQILCRKSAA
jgi:ubiquinone/menaquinone biosynthesis C-methylase UbiE